MQMRLKRRGLFRALVGPGDAHVISGRRLALSIGASPSYINNLASGRRTVCSRPMAKAIAGALHEPMDRLFEVYEGDVA